MSADLRVGLACRPLVVAWTDRVLAVPSCLVASLIGREPVAESRSDRVVPLWPFHHPACPYYHAGDRVRHVIDAREGVRYP